MTEKKIIISAEFVSSFREPATIPLSVKPEYAFTGRSNVGKSSLINMLTGRTHLAKISVKPGKTRLFNLFEINKSWNLMDMPGLGYAKVSKSDRKEWSKTIPEYLLERKNLVNVFVLVDVNIPPQAIDLNFINLLGESRIPFSIVFTKCDRSKLHQVNKNIASFSKELLKTWEELPKFFKTSATTKEGREELISYIIQVNEEVGGNL